MEFFAIVRKRRSIRRYQKQPVEPEKIALLLKRPCGRLVAGLEPVGVYCCR